MKAAPSCRGQERKGNLLPSPASWPLRGPRPARPSWRLLSRTWMRLSGGPCSAAWLPFPNAQPCPGSPRSEPACQHCQWALGWLEAQGSSVPAEEAEASLKMSSQNGTWGPLALHMCCLGLAFIDPREKNQVTPRSCASHGALSGWKPGRAFPELGHWRQKSGTTQVLPFCDSTLD